MYKKNKCRKSSIKRNTSYQGETIETKVARITNNKEPISDGAPLIYTERKDGVQPGYDIRTDRFEVAVEAMDKVSKSNMAKRERRHETEEQKIAREAKEGMKKEGEPGAGANTSDKV